MTPAQRIAFAIVYVCALAVLLMDLLVWRP